MDECEVWDCVKSGELFDGLVCWVVFVEGDGVVCLDEDVWYVY